MHIDRAPFAPVLALTLAFPAAAETARPPVGKTASGTVIGSEEKG